MIILGIDPGMATMGYGVIESSNNRIRVLENGVVTTPSEMETPKRLQYIQLSGSVDSEILSGRYGL